MSSLNVKITRKTQEGEEFFEGTVLLPKVRPTKLVRADGKTLFQKRSALSSAARSLAKTLSLEGVEFDDTTKKQAAKKSSSSRKS